MVKFCLVLVVVKWAVVQVRYEPAPSNLDGSKGVLESQNVSHELSTTDELYGVSRYEMAAEWVYVRAIEDGLILASLFTIISTNSYPFILIAEQLIKIMDLSLQ